MHYRHATAADVSLLAQMNHRLIRDEGHGNPMSPAELHARMAGWLQSGYEAALFDDAPPAGYALFRREPDFVYLRQFFVEPQRRRQGVGRQAVAWMLEHVWRSDVRIRLDVLIGNQPAIAFWRSLGFTDYCMTVERPVQLDAASSTIARP